MNRFLIALRILPFLLLLIPLITLTAVAQSWVSTTGPYAPPPVKDLSITTVGSVTTIYAACSDTLKYSTDHGVSWNYNSSLMLNPLTVALKPGDASKVNIGKLQGLYYSSDGGSSWTQKISDASNLVPIRVRYSPNSTNLAILGADTIKRNTIWTTSAYITTDGGASWNGISNFQTTHTNVNDIAFDPSSGSTNIWIGGSTSPVDQSPYMNAETGSSFTKGVWYSSNSGANWSFRGMLDGSTGVDRNVTALAISKDQTSQLLFAVTTKDVSGTRKAILYQSGDLGSTWTSTADLYSQQQIEKVRSIVVSPTDAYTLLISTDKGVFISSNRGVNWSVRSSGLEDAQQTYQLLYDGSDILVGADAALYKSTNQGTSWSTTIDVKHLMDVSGFTMNNGTDLTP
jgi:photosystem II stability/assembly factor-like uncharacterized protein